MWHGAGLQRTGSRLVGHGEGLDFILRVEEANILTGRDMIGFVGNCRNKGLMGGTMAEVRPVTQRWEQFQ